MEDTPEDVLDALIDILNERAEAQEEQQRREELRSKFG
jgi:hypothetical protein